MVQQSTTLDGSGPTTEAVLIRQAQAGCRDSLNALAESVAEFKIGKQYGQICRWPQVV